jgi:hypothetical protein
MRLSGPLLDSLVLGKFGRAGNRARTSGSTVRNSDHYTTEVVTFKLQILKIRIDSKSVIQGAAEQIKQF